MTLPAFLGIGALKAGTSTLHDLLARHPGAALPVHRKEVMYFDRHHARGLGWYAEHFAHSDGRVPGEISPNYLYDPAVPARVAAALPDVRLFVVLRDPVQRLYSQYKFHIKENRYGGDLAAFLEEHPNAVERGLYAAQLRRWLDHVDGSSLLALSFRELASTPHATLDRLLPHLGLPPAPLGDLHAASNAAARPRFHRVYAAGRQVARWLYDHDLAWIAHGLKRVGVRRVFVPDHAPEPVFPPLTPELRERLTDRYAADQAALPAILAQLAPGSAA